MKLIRRHRQPIASLLALLMAVWQVAPVTHAATVTWNASSGANFNWVDVLNWDSGMVPTTLDDLIFVSPIPNPGILPNPNVITLGAGSLANTLSFRDRYTLAGGDLTLTSGGVRVDAGVDARVDSILLAGTAGLTKTGLGSLRLTGVNTYTGTTTINQGSVVISGASALGAASSVIVVNGSPTRGFGGGSLVLEGGYSSGVTLARGLSLSGLGPISDRSAALNSVGNNTINGAVSMAVGTSLPNTRAVSTSGLLTFAGGLDVAGTAATTISFLGGASNTAGAGSYAVTGALTGPGTLEKSGAGTLFLTPSDTSGFSGTLRMSTSATGTQSSVRLTAPIVLGTRTATNTGGVIDMNGGILEVMMDAPSIQSGVAPAAANVYQRNNSTFYVDHALGSTATGGTLTLGQWAFEENFNAAFNVRNGYNVTIGATPVQGGTANSTFTNNMTGGTLTFTGAFWSNADSVSRTMTIAGNGNTTISGNVTAASAVVGADHSLTKTGTGTLQITSTGATLDGNLNVNGGTVQITDFRSVNMHSASTTNTGAINIGTGATAGTLTIGGAGTPTAAGLTLLSGKAINLAGTAGGATINASQTGANPVLISTVGNTGAGAKTLTLGGTSTASNLISGVLANNAANLLSVTKTDSGTWVLSGVNTYTGATTISGGTLRLNANAAASTILDNTSAITFNANTATGSAGGTLQFTGASGVATTEALGALTPTAGAGTIIPTANGAAANLTFASLGATTAASSVNFVTTGSGGGAITLTGQAATTATNLPGTANFQGHLYVNGADFAAINGSAQVITPVYGTTTGFVNAASALTASNHNLLTGSFSTGAAIAVSSLKLTTQTLTLGGNLTLSTGGLLQTGGAGTINGAGLISGGAVATNIAIRVNGASDSLTIASGVNVASAQTGGLTKNGAGTLIIEGTNAQTGTTTINEGTVRLSGASSRISATSAALVLRQGTMLEFNGTPDANAVVANFDGAGTVTNINAAPLTFTISGTANAFAGIIQDGAGVINLTKGGTTGTATLSGLSTYTGVTTIAGSTGLISTPNLANIGTASGIGRGNTAANAASLVFSATSTGGLNYTGTLPASTDRLFTLNSGTIGGGGQIANSSATNAPITFTNTGAIAFGVGATVGQTLTLGGSSTADNVFAPQITDNAALPTAVTKIGAGTWVLTGSNNYTGITAIGTGTTAGGVLQAVDGAGLSATSPLLLAAGTTGGGIFQTSGNFTRNIAATPVAGTGTITLGATTATTAAVGFSAAGGKLVVALGGVGTEAPLVWGSGGFMGTTGTSTGAFVLNNALSTSEVEVRNAIDLNGAVRTIQVDDNGNTGADFATITGVLSGTGTSGVSKAGTGILQLFGANTYTGNTTVTAGTLTVTSLGNSTSAGATSVGDSTAGNTTTGSLNLGNGTTGAGVLEYVGTGETTDRMIRMNVTTASNQIHASGTGALIITNLDNTMAAGARTLFLRGSSTAGNSITSDLADNGGALGITVDGGASWILSGANTFTGSTTVSAGALGLGNDAAAGAGTLILSNGSLFAFGTDRILTNAVTLANNTTPAFVGDYSVTLNGTFNNAAAANNTAFTNNIVTGKTLTIGTSVVNAGITAARNLTINGSGDTIITGDITTSTNFNLNLIYAGTGSLTLGGTASDLNGGSITFSSGTFRLGNTEVIPHGAVANTLTTAVSTASTTVTVADTAGLVPGQVFTGGTAAATVVSVDSPTTFTASAAQTLAVGAQLLFDPKAGNITMNPAVGVTATLDLNGNTETINGLTATSAGTMIINNSSATASGLTVGGNNQTVQFNGSITRTGGGGLALGKIGTGTATFAGPASLTSINVQGGGLKLTGGLTSPADMTSIQVIGGSLLNLQDGVGTPLANLVSLNLGAGAGIATLELDAGDLGSDTFTTSTAATVANSILLNIRDAGLTPGATYDLLVAPSGLNSGGVAYTLGPIGGYTGSSLVVTDTSIKLTVGTAVLGNMFWTGAGLPGPTGTTQWNTVDGSSNGVNWSTDKAGTLVSNTVPGAGTTVVFQANSATVTPLTTTLEQSFRVNNLIIETATVNPTALTIAPGAVATNRLTIQPTLATDGIELKTGATPLVTISAPFTAGSAQTWTVADSFSLTNANYATGSTAISVTSTTGLVVGMPVIGPGIPAGATVASITDGTNFVLSANTTAVGTNTTLGARSSVVISGGLSGSGSITKAGAGRVAVSGTGTYTGAAVTVNDGLFEIGAGTVLGGIVATPGAGTPVTVNSGTFYLANGTSTTVSNNLTLAGGTLSAAGNAHTYSGTVNVSADSSVNMLDPNTLNNARNITLPGVVSGTGKLTVNSITTASTGNQLTGTLALNGVNSGWSGGLLMQRGTVTTNNADGLGTGAITFNPFGRITLQGTNSATWNIANPITYADGAIGEIGVDNVSATVTAPFTVNITSPLNLGAASGARVFLSDGLNTPADFTGGIVLNGDASISVGGATGAVLVVSSVISEVGGARALAVNDDLGGWGTTNQTFRPTAANTFTGNLTLGEGTLQFSTVTDAGGAASNLGQGNAFTLGTGTLSFIGGTSQSTNRPITTNGSPTLNANGTSGATITYSGAITQAVDNALTLTGPGEGFITGGITQPAGAATADLNVSSGTWTISTANATIADDLLITGGVVNLQNMVFSLNDDIVVSNPGTILNLNTAGVWAANNPAGTSSFIFVRGGAVVNINANDVNGVNNANLIDGMLAGDGTTAGTGFINVGAFNISLPRLDMGGIATGFDGNVSGTTGVITGTSTATDYNTGFRLFRGVVSAKLGGVSTILKQGLGDVTLSGDNSGLTGTVAATRIDSGNLILDYTTQNNNKISAVAALDLRGGAVTINGNAAAPTTQAVNGLTLANGGANTINMNAGGAGQTATLTLAGITRATSAGTLRLNLGADTAVTTTTGNGTHGLVGTSAFATVKDATGTWFATRNVSNQIVAMASTVKNDVTTWLPVDHVTDDTTGFTGSIAATSAINSLRFNAAAGTAVNLAPAGILSIASGGVLLTDQVTSGSPSILGGTLTSGVAEIIVTHDSSRPLEISSAIGSNTGITKTGNGLVKLSGVNNSTGQLQIQGGTVQASGGNAIGDTSLVTLADDRVNSLAILNNETIGRLAGGSATTGLEALATVAIGGNTLTLNTTTAASTYAGMLTGSGTIVKEGPFNQAFSNISTGFTGSIVVNNSLFQLTGIGQINASSIAVNGQGNLLFDNNGTTRSGARVLDSTPITLNSASGTFSGEVRPRGLAIRTNQNATTSETIGSLNFASGNNWLTGEASGTTGVAAVIADNFTRSNNATVNVRGRALGLTTGDRNQFRIGTTVNETAWIAAAGNLVGGGAAPGTTLKNVSIVPWAVGENLSAAVADANMGNTFVTYVAGRGFVPLLLAAEYATYGAAAATDNVRESLIADATGLAGITLNSLIIHNDSTAASALNVAGNGAGQTLTNTSGAFLFTLNPTAAASSSHTVNVTGFDSGIAIGTTGEYVISVVNPSAAVTTPTLAVTIASPLTTAAHIVKSGRGTLVLSAVNTAGGGASRTVINEGAIEIGDLDNIGGNTGNLVLAGGTLRFGSTLTDDISSRSIILQIGGGTIDTNGVSLALAGSVGSGPGALTKTGLGTLTLNAASTYTGATNVNGGILGIGINNAISSGPLNVNGGGTLDLGANSISVGLVTTGGASPIITGTGTITSNVGFFLNHTGDTDIPVILAGSGGVLKAQTNTVTLSGANSFTGPVEIQAGAISVASIGNVGDLSSPLGAQPDAFTATVRLGSGTTTGAITYTGAGETSNRPMGLNGSTGGGTINANGTGALVLTGGGFAVNGGAKSLTLSGTAAPGINNQIGLVEDRAGPVTLTKAGTATWELTALNTYTGGTNVDEGILRPMLDNALPSATIVRMGSGTTAGTLDLTNTSQTVAGLTSTTNSATVTNSILIGSGKTLTVNGAVTLGANVDASTTLLTAAGAGSMVVNSAGANFQVGGATGGTNENTSTVDFSGLSSFTANLGAGTFRIGDANTTSGTPAPSTMKLAVTSAITAASIRVGDGSGFGNNHTLTLGSGVNTLNADTVNVGSAGTGIRSSGTVNFDAGDTTGSVVIRGSAGGSTPVANFNMVNSTGATTANMDATVNLAGHTADISATNMVMASRAASTGSTTTNFTFDQGTLAVTTLNMASRTGAGTGDATATVTLGDSAAPGSPTTTIGTVNMAVNTSAGGTVTSNLVITGGTVNIGTGSGTAINMANAAASRTAISNINLTGGTLSATGNIVRTGGAGTETATITVNGGSLNMNGNSIGTAGAPITLQAQSGTNTITGLAELNGGGLLTKSTAGALSMGNGNTYTGGTSVTDGTLLATNTTGSATGTGAVSVAAAGTLGGTGSIIAGSNNNITIDGTLDAGLPAASSGTALALTVGGTGALAMNGSTLFQLFTGGGTGTPNGNTAADQVVVNAPNWSNVVFGGASTLTITTGLTATSFVAGDSWKIFDWVGVAAGSAPVQGTNGFNSVVAPTLDPGFSWDYSALFTSGLISVVVVPEPSRALLLMLGLFGLMIRRRRK